MVRSTEHVSKLRRIQHFRDSLSAPLTTRERYISKYLIKSFARCIYNFQFALRTIHSANFSESIESTKCERGLATNCAEIVDATFISSLPY